MTLVRYLAASILLDAELDNAHLLLRQWNLSLDPDNSRALETGGDTAVEILLAGDVEFTDDVRLQQQGYLEPLCQRLAV